IGPFHAAIARQLGCCPGEVGDLQPLLMRGRLLRSRGTADHEARGDAKPGTRLLHSTNHAVNPIKQTPQSTVAQSRRKLSGSIARTTCPINERSEPTQKTANE